MKDVIKFNEVLNELKSLSIKYGSSSSITECKELVNRITELTFELNKMYNEVGNE